MAAEMDYSFLTEDEIYKYQKAFHDSHLGNGEITVEKVMAVFQAMGEKPAPQDVQKLVRSLAQKKTPIEFSDLLIGMSNLIQVKATEEDMQIAFKAFDLDRNGYLTPDEIRKVLTMLDQRMTSKEVEELVACIDKDGDGKIDYKEFAKMMTS